MGELLIIVYGCNKYADGEIKRLSRQQVILVHVELEYQVSEKN